MDQFTARQASFLLLPLAALLLALSSLVLGVVFTTAVTADADSRTLFSLTNTLATLMEMVVIGLGIASLVVTATALRARRTPGSRPSRTCARRSR